MKGDAYSGATPKLLDQATVRELSQLNPYRSMLQIGLEWIGITAIVVITDRFWSLPLYILAVLLIGGRQHALGVLMHEGAHKRLLKSHRLNDLVGNLFCAWPILSTVEGYRRTHFAHHRETNTDSDPDWLLKKNKPDWKFPKTWPGLVWLFIRDVTAMNTLELVQIFRRYGNSPKSRNTSAQSSGRGYYRLIYYLLAAVLLTVFSCWWEFLLFWIVPFLTTFKAFIRWRSIAEHFGVEYDHILRQSRTTYPGLLGRLMVGPIYINYHIEHHLYPSVPFYNMPKLHQALIDNTEFRNNAHITKNGYWGVLKECAR